MRWEWQNGYTDAFQGVSQALSPSISVAKGWDRWHFLGAVRGRIPTYRHNGNYSLTCSSQWGQCSYHADLPDLRERPHLRECVTNEP